MAQCYTPPCLRMQSPFVRCEVIVIKYLVARTHNFVESTGKYEVQRVDSGQWTVCCRVLRQAT